MRRFSFALLLLLPAPALADAQGSYAQWKYLRDPSTLQISFGEGHRFLSQHGDWPEAKTIQLRTEEAALNQSPDGSAMRAFCEQFPPLSGRGMLACVTANAAGANREAWLKQGWLQGDFSPYEEELVLNRFGGALSHEDHEARADRLLYEGKINSAQRMMSLVSHQRVPLYEARIALITGARNANAKLEALPGNYRNDPGIMFDRIRWRHKKGLDAGVAELFVQSPEDPPYPDLWWPLRAIAVREAMASAQYGEALEIIRRHGELTNREFLAEALWLKGWINLEFRGNAGEGYKAFYDLYTNVGTPVSKARAAYWAGRAATKNGNAGIARDWFEKAAAHPTVFYGQLAHLQLHPGVPLELPEQPYVSDAAKQSFAQEEMAQVVRLLAERGEEEEAELFLVHMASVAQSRERLALLADLGESVMGKHGGVLVAKAALRQGVVLTKAGWPMPTIPDNIEIEPALALAITRQESEFDPRAQSRANARGLMQLLPGTANETARRFAIPYSPDKIWNEDTNVLLGSAYLGSLVNAWDDSYILAIASYNAGPANARRWREDYGHPSGDIEQSINWIESIPFSETRNYVQRVMENLQVYRTRLHSQQKVALAQDLTR